MTYEDVKKIRENPTLEDVDNQELHTLIDAAIDKQIPKKLYSWNCTVRKDFCKVECPVCLGTHILRYKPEYCVECGQKLDWSLIDERIGKERYRIIDKIKRFIKKVKTNLEQTKKELYSKCGKALNRGGANGS